MFNWEGFATSQRSLVPACYNIISNNSQNKYGTATIVKNEFYVENVGFDSKGRVIIFDKTWSSVSNSSLVRPWFQSKTSLHFKNSGIMQSSQ